MKDEEEQLVDDYIAELVDAGALEAAGVSDDGEFLYQMNHETMQEVCPEFWAETVSATTNAMAKMAIDGLIEKGYDEESGLDWTLTDFGKEFYSGIEQGIFKTIVKMSEDDLEER